MPVSRMPRRRHVEDVGLQIELHGARPDSPTPPHVAAEAPRDAPEAGVGRAGTGWRVGRWPDRPRRAVRPSTAPDGCPAVAGVMYSAAYPVRLKKANIRAAV